MFKKKSIFTEDEKVLLIQILNKEWQNLANLLKEVHTQNNLDLYLSVNGRVKQCDQLINKIK